MLCSPNTAVPSTSTRITNRQHAVVRTFRRLASTSSSSDVLLDGAHLLSEALAAHAQVHTVLTSPDFRESATAQDRALVSRAAERGATVYDVSRSVLEAASPVRTPSGIVAHASWSPAPLDALFMPAPALVIGLVDVQDPGNVGGVIRSADALGATGVAALGSSANPATWKALRGAMGSTFRIAVARSPLADAIAAAKLAGARIIATTASDGTAADEADLSQSVLLLVGNEGAGLGAAVIAQSDVRIRIPMRRGVNSLNVGVTAALLLYEARQQREPRR